MTPREERLLDFMRARAGELVQPTFTEMMEPAGVTSKSHLHRMLQNLKAAGLVEKLPGSTRCWRAVRVDQFAGIEDKDLALELERRGYIGKVTKPHLHDGHAAFRVFTLGGAKL